MAFLAVFLQILEYFFQILQNSIIFASFVFKINPFWICIIQNSSKFFTYFQILSFLKISPWNLKFSFIFRLSPLCMNEEKWKKSQEIKFYIDLFSNSVLCFVPYLYFSDDSWANQKAEQRKSLRNESGSHPHVYCVSVLCLSFPKNSSKCAWGIHGVGYVGLWGW